MEIEAPQRVFRVTVRGRFGALTDEARRYLVKAQPEHDIFLSRFSEEGTFTYDDRIQFFNFRYELRAGGADAEQVVTERATSETQAFLRTLKIDARDLRVTMMDMSAMWSPTRAE